MLIESITSLLISKNNHLEQTSKLSKFVLNTVVAWTIHPAPAYMYTANPTKRSLSTRAQSARKN